MKLIFLFILIFCSTGGSVSVYAQLRMFSDIFPNINEELRSDILNEKGYVRSSQRSRGFVIIGNERESKLDPQIVDIVLSVNPGYLVESISVIPGIPGTVSLLDIYNALGNVRNLKGRLYDSATRGQPTPLFEEATRVAGERQTNEIPDPPPASVLPEAETVFIRLRDANFGNTFYRAEMALVQNGIRYTLTNFRNMTYLFVPVIREGKFVAQLYIEPIYEGVLIYSIAGADISDFFASRIHVESAISKRLAVITEWAADGIISKF